MAELRSRHFGERESAWVFTVTSLLVHDAAQLPFHRLESVADHFVDTPEEERVYADRIAEQAAYFGITPDAGVESKMRISPERKHARPCA